MSEIAADWTDLSVSTQPGTTKTPFLHCPESDHLSEQSETSLQVSQLPMATHVGNHVDAPCHAVADGESIDEHGADEWLGRKTVREVDAEPESGISLGRGMDSLTPPRPPELRPEGFTCSVAGAPPRNTTLPSSDTLVVENLANLRGLARATTDVAALPTKPARCDGAPLRVVARELES